MVQKPQPVFYVDDDADDLIFFKEAIDSIGRDVSLFSIPQNMLEALRQREHHPALIFIDLNMGGMTGFDVLAEITASDCFRHIPVVVLSTSANPKSIVESRNYGARYYITKPQSITSLKKAIAWAIQIDWSTFSPSLRDFVYRERH